MGHVGVAGVFVNIRIRLRVSRADIFIGFYLNVFTYTVIVVDLRKYSMTHGHLFDLMND